MHASELWESGQLSARIGRTALLPASWLYALGWELYLGVYASGLKRSKEPHRPVVCIGNLQVGGSGKTPLTLFVARLLRQLKREVVVSCSGYGAPHAASASLAPEGELDARVWGDEPAMIRWLEPGIPLVVGRDRVAAAAIANQMAPNGVVLMDDGFQHLPLRKHVTILADPEHPKNRACLPAGPYREPRFNRRRADLIIPDRFYLEAKPMRLFTPQGGEVRPAAYSVLCALGRPQPFLEALASQFPKEATSVPKLILPDHDPLSAGNLLAGLPPDLPIVVTAKDWVKLRERPDLTGRTILIASHEVVVQPEKAFSDWLSERLDGL